MRHLFPILVMVFIVTAVLIFFFGDSGILAWSGLQEDRQILAAKVADLEQRNAALQAELESLRQSPSRFEEMARSVDFYRPDDQVVRFAELPPLLSQYNPGEPWKRGKNRGVGSVPFKAFGLGASALLLAYAALFRSSGRKKKP